jgi:hypothetical protein
MDNLDYITTRNKRHDHNSVIMSKSGLFTYRMIIKVYDDRIEFSPASLDNTHNVKCLSLRDTGWYEVEISPVSIPCGKLFFDEDSDEDLIVVYFDDERNILK